MLHYNTHLNQIPSPHLFEPTERLDAFRGDRTYLGADHRRNERRTWIVTAICAATLAAQVAGGVLFRSMALTASGLHMAAHVAALLVAAGAYALARRHAQNPRFAFGTGKLGYLAGFANAVVLGMTAVLIAWKASAAVRPQAVDWLGPAAGGGGLGDPGLRLAAQAARPSAMTEHRRRAPVGRRLVGGLVIGGLLPAAAGLDLGRPAAGLAGGAWWRSSPSG